MLGVNTISFTASDPNSSNLSQTTTATLTVLDHAAAAFSNGGTVLNLNFGTLQVGSGTQSLQFQIENLPAAYRAALDLDSVMVLSDPGGVFSTDAAPFADLAPGAMSNLIRCVPRYVASGPVLRRVPVQSVGRKGSQRPRRAANADAQRDCGGRAGTLAPLPSSRPVPSACWDTRGESEDGTLGRWAETKFATFPKAAMIPVHLLDADTKP